uniref:Squalene monooxygenase n=1 Tax=Kalanchoe fedtschenkoi TaxID=63787 RepID=A0A7N0TN51_KALFE
MDFWYLLCAAGVILASNLSFFLAYARKSGGENGGVEVERREAAVGGDDDGGVDDVIIVGAGVAGAALAHTLAKDGRRVRVIERDLSEQDRIVGELLQPGGYLKLIELGLQDCVEKIDSQQVHGYALFMEGRSAKLTYPLKDLSSCGRGFHNGRFVQRLRAKAATHANVRLEQGTVTSLIEEKGTVKGVRYRTKAGAELCVRAPLTIVCDGCSSNLRRTLCHPQVEVPSCFVGMVLEECDLPHSNYGHVIMADPSPVLFYPISSNEVRCLVDVPGRKLPSLSNGDLARYLKTKIAPQLHPQLRKSFIAAIEKGNIKTMPNRSMPASPLPTPGALLLGGRLFQHETPSDRRRDDRSFVRCRCPSRPPQAPTQFERHLGVVRVPRVLLHPPQGTIPRLDSRLLHDVLKSQMKYYIDKFKSFIVQPVASTINTLAGALYRVFGASPDPAMREMRSACFDYLSLGGNCANGPISILAGLNPVPLALLFHFFSVALYGVGRLLLPFPSPGRIWLSARLLRAALSIIFPIMSGEGLRQMFLPATIPAYHRSPPAWLT